MSQKPPARGTTRGESTSDFAGETGGTRTGEHGMGKVVHDVASKLDRETWFAQYVVTTVGVASVQNTTESFWVNYYGFKISPWANRVDEPKSMFTPGWHRLLSPRADGLQQFGRPATVAVRVPDAGSDGGKSAERCQFNERPCDAASHSLRAVFQRRDKSGAARWMVDGRW